MKRPIIDLLVIAGAAAGPSRHDRGSRASPSPWHVSAMALKIYTLENCSTCRAATKWLQANAVTYDERAIRDTPPSCHELKTVLAATGGQLRRLFNTSGRDYREQKLGERLASLSEDAAIELLAKNGNLVKRPFVVGDGVALVGFDEKAWMRALLGGE